MGLAGQLWTSWPVLILSQWIRTQYNTLFLQLKQTTQEQQQTPNQTAQHFKAVSEKLRSKTNHRVCAYLSICFV